MENFIPSSIIVVLACVSAGTFAASIPPTPFLEYFKEYYTNQECHFPPPTPFEKFNEPDFLYKSCLQEAGTGPFTRKICDGIANLSKQVCDLKSSLRPSGSDMVLHLEYPKDVSLPAISKMCAANDFRSLAEETVGTNCTEECASKESFLVCELYFEMDKLERSKFQEIKDFHTLDTYLYFVDRHSFPPAELYKDDDMPFHACLLGTPESKPLCDAILEAARVISETCAVKIDKDTLLKNITGELTWTCEKFSTLSGPALKSEIWEQLIDETKCTEACKGNNTQLCKALYLGMSTIPGEVTPAQPAGETPTETETVLVPLGRACTAPGDKCVENATCVKDSGDGHYSCQCLSGFIKDVSENACVKTAPVTSSAPPAQVLVPLGRACTAPGDKCVENATCVKDSGDGHYSCQCLSGFIKDVSENACVKTAPVTSSAPPAQVLVPLGRACTAPGDKCVENATCVKDSGDGNYSCQCLSGFIKDVSENACVKTAPVTSSAPPAQVLVPLGRACTAPGDKCVENATCVKDSGDGNYSCQCLSGFIKDVSENACVKTAPVTSSAPPAQALVPLGDTCKSANDPNLGDKCDGNATCVKNSGDSSYSCQCLEGFVKDVSGNACVKTAPVTTSAPSSPVLISLGEACKPATETDKGDKCVAYAECVQDNENDNEDDDNEDDFICQCQDSFKEDDEYGETCVSASTTTPWESSYSTEESSNEEEVDHANERPPPAVDVAQNEPTYDRKMPAGKSYDDESSGGTSFISYFLVFTVLVVAGYLIFHNKQKIIALVVEGKGAGRNGRRPNTKEYRQLKTDDVMPSLEKSAGNKNYVF